MKRSRTGSPGSFFRSLLVLLFGALTAALAQDPFEIHIYEYETLAPGGYTLEGHLNYVLQGTKISAAPLAPSQHQFHMTYELTRGITKETSLGFMFLTAVRPDGSGLEYAGVRSCRIFTRPNLGIYP